MASHSPPDITFYYFMYGFPVVGDGSAAEPGVRDIGLFRKVDRPSQSSVSDLACGLANSYFSNTQWLRRVCSMLRARASAAPPSSESHAAIAKAHELAEKRDTRPPATYPHAEHDATWPRSLGSTVRRPEQGSSHAQICHRARYKEG